MSENRILLVVDPQNDFISGSLQVGGAELAMTKLASYIANHGNEYDGIYITADWHPLTHCSFKDNGGEWPIHCVQFTSGAAIYQPIINALNEKKLDYEVLTKGINEDREEYSIFKNEVSLAYFKAINKHNTVTRVDVAGLAGDVCVMNSVADGLRVFTNAEFRIFKEFSPSIDGGNKLDKFVGINDRVTWHE
jgi:nicotinamidase/pyrazinamidase